MSHSTTNPDVVPLPDAAISMLRASASQACAVLKAMAHEDRLLLLCQLTQGERNVGELEALVGLHQPSLSQQLGVLRDEGLVTTRREGKYIYYRLASFEVIQIMQTLSELYCGKVLKKMAGR
ncbi:Biofilm growth-associated repressor [Ralstonia sp. LMG 32965]|uniref:Biofilm growth-associated repressor n=2 Tax=Ralstonia TaxID=48736 RepID=A0ABN9KHV1_9RALS|nr:MULTISPECIES: metalloregulator ArsR/SmtB family transcription factor [Ralstonia]MBN6211181.1 winged helix-turn-helix transcriptional regulator [Ralstonia pickettii]PLC39976.1 transcriptional regulator [Ralstonia pickettii]CAJ0874754.1 Biofilm growth-associated repressor [Ralstonia sp. LMG 32965]CAJ0896915.1 Biofilm growth-associated repressor [Ralstonia sp. LMG 32965]